MRRAAELAEAIYNMPRNTSQLTALPGPRSPASALNNAAAAAAMSAAGFNMAYSAVEYSRAQNNSVSPSRGYASNASTPQSNSGGSSYVGGGGGGSHGGGGGGGGGTNGGGPVNGSYGSPGTVVNAPVPGAIFGWPGF